MRNKTFLAALALIGLMAASCTGSSSSESMFGGIPEIYEEKLIDIVKELKKATDNNDQAEAMKKLGTIAEAYDEATEEARPKAEAMKGKTIPYEVNDSVPYSIVSDITVDSVRLPEFKLLGKSKDTRLDISFDITMKEDTKGPFTNLYYFITDGERAIGYGQRSIYSKKKKGETFTVNIIVEMPSVPAEIARSCSKLSFVTEGTYDLQRKAIKAQADKWNEEFTKKNGLK